ncbi:precorrin-3B synthase [Reyranella sp.]|uniref:precorrin-3B synthase n=1 Tax=Reyranella sp. TaxID=1929291 RepID=UPI003BA8D2F0
MSAAIAAKGWCPGILRPMPSGDGLLVRVRPRGGGFAPAKARALAGLAERWGSGHIDLTRRANVQLRGVSDVGLAALQDGLADLGLLDRDAETEAVRNVMVAPLAGEAMRTLATALETALTTDRRLASLPAKFGLLVDGGPLKIAGERADVALAALDDGVALGLDAARGTLWLGTVPRERAAAAAIAALHAFLDLGQRCRVRDLAPAAFTRLCAAVAPALGPLARIPSAGGRRLGPIAGVGADAGAVGIAAPFGRMESEQLRRLALLAGEAGAAELRLSPWRTFYVRTADDPAACRLAGAAATMGLIVDEADGLLRVEACPGAPACTSSSVDTRRDARWLAALAARHAYRGTVHVSGCAKGCARSAPSDLVLVGQGGAYGVLHDATARGNVERTVGPADFVGLFASALAERP